MAEKRRKSAGDSSPETPRGDREHDDDMAPEVQENSEIETEEYPGAFSDLEEDESPDSVGTDGGDRDHDDSI
jgi:hypothetical protein